MSAADLSLAVVDGLTHTRKLVEEHWIQRDYALRENDGTACGVCLIGAIGITCGYEVTDDVCEAGHDGDEDLFQLLVAAIYWQLRDDDPDWSEWALLGGQPPSDSVLIRWNDERACSERQVLEVIDRAIVRLRSEASA